MADPSAGEQSELPVDSPDEEHAVFAATADAVAFTPETTAGSYFPWRSSRSGSGCATEIIGDLVAADDL